MYFWWQSGYCLGVHYLSHVVESFENGKYVSITDVNFKLYGIQNFPKTNIRVTIATAYPRATVSSITAQHRSDHMAMDH